MTSMTLTIDSVCKFFLSIIYLILLILLSAMLVWIGVSANRMQYYLCLMTAGESDIPSSLGYVIPASC